MLFTVVSTARETFNDHATKDIDTANANIEGVLHVVAQECRREIRDAFEAARSKNDWVHITLSPWGRLRSVHDKSWKNLRGEILHKIWNDRQKCGNILIRVTIDRTRRWTGRATGQKHWRQDFNFAKHRQALSRWDKWKSNAGKGWEYEMDANARHDAVYDVRLSVEHEAAGKSEACAEDYTRDLIRHLAACPCVVCRARDHDDTALILRLKSRMLWNNHVRYRRVVQTKNKAALHDYIFSSLWDHIVDSVKDAGHRRVSFLGIDMCWFAMVVCRGFNVNTVLNHLNPTSKMHEVVDFAMGLSEQDIQDRIGNGAWQNFDIAIITDPKVTSARRRNFMSRISEGRVPWVSPMLCEFFNEFFEYIVEWHPTGGRSHMPSTMKLEIYLSEYLPWAERNKRPKLQPKCFWDVWRTYYSAIAFKDKSRFTQCDFCAACNEAILTCKETGSRQRWLLLKSAHLEDIRNCRRLLMAWQSVAKSNIGIFLFLLGDRMDANKTTVPRPYRLLFISRRKKGV